LGGPDPDSGTAWECGYAFGKKPVVLVRTDVRAQTGSGGPYNPMLIESATIRLDLPFASMAQVIVEVLDALGRLEETGPKGVRAGRTPCAGRDLNPQPSDP
jgi:hypothetical protein